MTFTVDVVSEAEFDAHLEENAPDDGEEALVTLGEAQWTAACAKCHGAEGEGGGVGPPIAGNGTLTNPEGLTRLLYDGQNRPDQDYYMPPVGRGWSDRQIEALVAYVRSNEALAPEEAGNGG
jgi:mono/diheme cytochrome c family protein